MRGDEGLKVQFRGVPREIADPDSEVGAARLSGVSRRGGGGGRSGELEVCFGSSVFAGGAFLALLLFGLTEGFLGGWFGKGEVNFEF